MVLCSFIQSVDFVQVKGVVFMFCCTCLSGDLAPLILLR
ncbi:hypothetical protein JCM19237_3334 [Photobacterium aphoticum]|uniref:Uncharacterized protein n=1 Tax=Photobacterium aphoticum TaxID=754436 RepID=A0A090QW26_9GAMM|nr:hypothetical protein JCM19237_3334 [Photobacterium aphoticum]